MWDELTPDAQDARTRQQMLQPATPIAHDPGIFDNFASGAGRYFMRGMAESGRAISMAAGAIPVALQAGIDKIDPGGRVSDSRLDDSYFKWHDSIFGGAVDYWTPKPGEVGTAGQVLGSVAAGITQFIASPALAVGTAQMSAAEDLVRRGVDPGASLLAGDIAGLGTIVGIKIPIVGGNLTQRVASGIAGNVGQGMAQAGATAAVLKAAGAAQVAAEFNPFDLKARTIDALMGAVFGVAGHIGAPRQELTQTQKDALLLVNQARHLEDASTPGKPATEADLTASVAATRQAIDQMLRGEPVAVDEVAARATSEADPVKAAQRAEIAQVVANELPKPADPIRAPDMTDPGGVASQVLEIVKGKDQPTPPVAPGMVRMYHGGEPGNAKGPLSFSRDKKYAQGWASKDEKGARLWYVDVPEGHPALGQHPEDFAAGLLPPTNANLPAEFANQRKVFTEVSASQSTAPPPPTFDPSVRVPTGEFDPKTGNPITISANDYVTQQHEQARSIKETASNFMSTVANCLLGSL